MFSVVSVRSTDPPSVGRVTINKLPYIILLEVFKLFVNEANQIEEWHTLVHVCRTWRNIVFDSPRHLDLRLLCTARRRVRELLYIWPALPIVICDRDGPTSLVEGVDNIIAALEPNDRVREIVLKGVPGSLWKKLAGVMQQPFPALIGLEIHQDDISGALVPVLPDLFLGDSAPGLRTLDLYGIPVPPVWELLCSANRLVKLHLHDIPHFGYIPPDAMASQLSALPRLESFSLEFRSPLFRPHSTLPWPLTHVVLPALTSLFFTGVSEYLEDFVSTIDAPVLDNVTIAFFNQLVFEIPRLHNFISRTERLVEREYARVVFTRHSVEIRVSPEIRTGSSQWLRLGILCTEPDWQVLSLTQVYRSRFTTLSTLKRLEIVSEYSPWQNNAENTQWLEFLRLFTDVKDLYLSAELALRVTPALQELPGLQLTEVLPMLQNLFVEGLQPPPSVQAAVEYFVAGRQVVGYPISVNRWEIEE